MISTGLTPSNGWFLPAGFRSWLGQVLDLALEFVGELHEGCDVGSERVLDCGRFAAHGLLDSPAHCELNTSLDGCDNAFRESFGARRARNCHEVASYVAGLAVE